MIQSCSFANAIKMNLTGGLLQSGKAAAEAAPAAKI
jgi:ABC-type phosphate transport system permease subunit